MAKIAVCHRLMTNLLFGKQAWYDAGAGSYFAPSSTLFAIQLFLFAWVEGRRMQDYNKPGTPFVIRPLIHKLACLQLDCACVPGIVSQFVNRCRLGQSGPHLHKQQAARYCTRFL